MSARDQTVPLGLCGVLMMMARVRGVMAAAIASKSGRKVPGVSGTCTAVRAGQADVRVVAVVAGLEHDHLVARVAPGQDRREDGLRRAGRDRDLAARVVAVAVQRLDLRGDRARAAAARRPSAGTG